MVGELPLFILGYRMGSEEAGVLFEGWLRYRSLGHGDLAGGRGSRPWWWDSHLWAPPASLPSPSGKHL